jgi:hypothetical protein
MGILTPRKVTIQHQLVVPSGSSDNDLPLVKHDARVDLKPVGARIRYTQEHVLMSISPPLCPPPYIMSRPWVGVGHGKVLIPHRTWHRGWSDVVLLQRSAVRTEWWSSSTMNGWGALQWAHGVPKVENYCFRGASHRVAPGDLRPVGRLRCASQSHHEQVEALRQGFRRPITLQCSISNG